MASVSHCFRDIRMAGRVEASQDDAAPVMSLLETE